MTTRAYVRRSTGKQSMSLKGQVIYLRELVKDLRRKDPSIEPLVPENIFIETKSGKDDEDEPKARPVFNSFIESLCPGDLALFVHNDRLSRNTVVVLRTVHDLTERKRVRIVFGNISGIDVTTPEGEMMLTNLAAFAKYFLDDLKRKTKAGLAAAREEGKRSGHVPSFFEEADDESGRRVLRPTALAFEVERMCEKKRGATKAAAKYLPEVPRTAALQRLLRFRKAMRSWRETGPWIRLREDERERRIDKGGEETFDVATILAEGS